MIKKLAIVGLFTMGVFALAPKDASARVCLVKNGSTCFFWSGSVECDLTANGVGNVKKDPKSLGCVVSTFFKPNVDANAVIACGNPGSKRHPAPGIQPLLVALTLEDYQPIGKQDVDRNGNASVTVVTTIDSLTDDQLRDLSNNCPNPNWTVIDFVPFFAEIDAPLLDEDDNVIGSAHFTCELPEPETLQWDNVAQGFERRQYKCEQN